MIGEKSMAIYRIRMFPFHQGQQSPVSGAEVENAARGAGNELQQRGFAFCAIFNGESARPR